MQFSIVRSLTRMTTTTTTTIVIHDDVFFRKRPPLAFPQLAAHNAGKLESVNTQLPGDSRTRVLGTDRIIIMTMIMLLLHRTAYRMFGYVEHKHTSVHMHMLARARTHTNTPVDFNYADAPARNK